MPRAIQLSVWIFFATSIFALPASAQKPTKARIATLERFIEAQRKIDRIPGLSIALYHDGFTWARGFCASWINW